MLILLHLKNNSKKAPLAASTLASVTSYQIIFTLLIYIAVRAALNMRSNT